MTALLALLLMSPGCGEDEPVLSAIQPGGAADATEAVPGYEKPEGVLVDVQYLAGKSWDSIRDEVSRQMGDVVSSRPLSLPGGQEYEVERGLVRVSEGRIYEIRVDLGEPMRRTEALAVVGLPPQIDRWGGTHREYRLRWVWSFDRIRLGRTEPYTQSVDWIEVRRWDPRSHSGR